MTSNAATTYTPSVDGAPSMRLPDHVDGFIDLATLADIHRFLNQSSLDDDKALAAWIQQNYLYHPMNTPGREIRTTEGFSKLDRAYRRVRSLTNKAQDKWPFFDRKWKSMSSTTVRNNARGEAAPGVSLPGMIGATHDSIMTNGHGGHKDDATPDHSSTVSFGASTPGFFKQGKSVYHQNFAKPVPNTYVPIPGPKQARPEPHSDSEKHVEPEEQPQFVDQSQANSTPTQALSNNSDLFSQSSRQTTAQSEPLREVSHDGTQLPSDEIKEIATRNAEVTAWSVDSAMGSPLTEEEIARDAGGGKVRGPNGRYLPKTLTSPKPTKSRRSIRGAKPKSTIVDQEAKIDPEEVASSSPAQIGSNDTTMVDAHSAHASINGDTREERGELEGTNAETAPASEPVAPAPTAGSDNGEQRDRAFSEPSANNLSTNMASNGFSVSFTLAAEAEPISSNLDRLPPSSLRKYKRKSEPVPVSTQPPRKRGRPRKDQTAQHADQSARAEAQAVDEESQSPGEKIVEEEIPRMTTRRTTRKSMIASADSPTPVKGSLATEPVQQLKFLEDEDKTMVDVDDSVAAAGLEPPVVKQPPAENSSKRAPAKKKAVSKASSKSAATFSKDVIDENNVDLLSLGLRKTGRSTRRSESKKTSLQQSEEAHNKGLPADGSMKSVFSTLDESTTVSARTNEIANGLTNGTTNGIAAPETPTPSTSVPIKIELFARVHTSMGVMEAAIESDNIEEETKLVREWAETVENEGEHITFKLYKKIQKKLDKTTA
ncbi:hypothetical protein FB567DRAFT_547119 [Paraphoma chrysanthemicola]|uniref:Uncharacterized protein n=1 Tax=Paraphoma chrysanthemicola TaxID=798071 RepID=A0A8K0R994_9PLEO|nr:hypothetical protein FB567DRAFT_547119 [Paraphoma chrysanthemicola]